MKILIGSESFFPGISGLSVYTHTLAKNLSERGHSVYIVVPSTHVFDFGVFKKDGYKLYRLHSIPNPFRKKFRITFFPMGKIKGILDREKPDIIHLQDPNFICQSLKKLASKMKIPVIAHNHFTIDYVLAYIMYLKPLHAKIRTMLSEKLTNFYNECNCVITPSRFVSDELISRGVKSPVKIVPMGIDFKRFNGSLREGKNSGLLNLPDKYTALYTGRIDKDKNLDVFFRSMPIILKKTDMHFIICGTGNRIKYFKNLAKKLKITNNVSFMGPFKYTDKIMPQIYKNADVFIMPSGIETQSIVTLEAMAAGLPIIGAKGGALPEYIKENLNGLLFNPESPQALANAVVFLYNNKGLAESMKKVNMEFAKNHTIDKTIDEIEKIYEELRKK